MTVFETADNIIKAGWQRGQTIRLFSCNTGRNDEVFNWSDGTVSESPGIAERLSMILGVTVIAPNGYLGVNQRGEFSGIELVDGTSGSWVTYNGKQ